MDCYEGFAYVYDTFMSDTPYEQWCSLILKYLKSNGRNDGIILDLGCGTGKLTELLADVGYDMIGIDFSYDMLNVAREQMLESGKDILYLCQDMREFELYGTVSAVVSVCDSLNYILEDSELKTVFSLVNNYLDPAGLFLFDFNTDYKYREVIGDTTIAENRENCSFIWENDYDVETKINEYDLTIFHGVDGIHYEKIEETHFQKGYQLEEIINLLEQAGMEFVEAIDADTKETVTENTERVFCIAREKGKV